MISSLLPIIPFLLTLVVTGVEATSCSATTLCPASAPCCSDYGFCGTGSYCQGGCNPMASFKLDSCRPNPVCLDTTYTFQNTSRILTNATLFDGNVTKYDWVVDKGDIIISDGSLGLILTQGNGGTKMSSTRYVHYGTITAKLKTGRWGGVVTAFITMSDIHDEIDLEYPGNRTTEAQSNYFWQGLIPEIRNGATHKNLTDTFSNFHEYTVDWQPTALTFSIDGKVVRTVKQSETNGQYPNTPSRIQLSLWPGGIDTLPQGTIDWSGGKIQWDDPDYKAAGHFYALFESVSVKCADPVKPTADITSYVYGPNVTANTPSISFSNQTLVVSGSIASVPFHLHTVLTLAGTMALALFVL